MTSKIQTTIGQIIEGKIISVTICHECHDVSNQCFYVLCIKHIATYVLILCTYLLKVSENIESFFDISLPMPEENFLRVCTFLLATLYIRMCMHTYAQYLS